MTYLASINSNGSDGETHDANKRNKSDTQTAYQKGKRKTVKKKRRKKKKKPKRNIIQKSQLRIDDERKDRPDAEKMTQSALRQNPKRSSVQKREVLFHSELETETKLTHDSKDYAGENVDQIYERESANEDKAIRKAQTETNTTAAIVPDEDMTLRASRIKSAVDRELIIEALEESDIDRAKEKGARKRQSYLAEAMQSVLHAGNALADDLQFVRNHSERCATIIQKNWRMKHALLNKNTRVASALKLQTFFRMIPRKRSYARLKRQSTVIQRWWRRQKRRLWKKVVHEEMKSAVRNIVKRTSVRRRAIQSLSHLEVVNAGDRDARGVYEMVSTREDGTVEYAKISKATRKGEIVHTYVIERVPGSTIGDPSKPHVWILARINGSSGDFSILYANALEGASLKPPHRGWQVCKGQAPVPQLVRESKRLNSRGSSFDEATNIDSYVVIDGGANAAYGHYIRHKTKNGVSSYVREHKDGDDENFEIAMRRVNYGNRILWLIIGQNIHCKSEAERKDSSKIYYVYEESAGTMHNRPPTGNGDGTWVCGRDGQEPILVVYRAPLLDSGKDGTSFQVDG